jgi:hypothetical protein
MLKGSTEPDPGGLALTFIQISCGWGKPSGYGPYGLEGQAPLSSEEEAKPEDQQGEHA